MSYEIRAKDNLWQKILGKKLKGFFVTADMVTDVLAGTFFEIWKTGDVE